MSLLSEADSDDEAASEHSGGIGYHGPTSKHSEGDSNDGVACEERGGSTAQP